MQDTYRACFALCASVTALSLAGCGGGGGAQPQPMPAPPVAQAPAPPPPPPPSTLPPLPQPNPQIVPNGFDDREYNRSPSAVVAGAITAYEAGATGRDVTIAYIDSGINATLSEFIGRIHPASKDMVGNRGLIDTEDHGTAVAAIAAAARNDNLNLGVAFDSRILSLNTSNLNCTQDDCGHSSSSITQAIDYARENGARVINISLGGSGAPTSLLDAVRRAAAAGIVVVLSAGNDTAANPDGFAMDIASAGSGNVIIAGAHTQVGEITSFSNRAGAGAPFYLLALGDDVRTINRTGQPVIGDGTSFSTPAIGGAVALLAQAFPNLTGAQIVEILLTSAWDVGATGRDSIYGNGVLSITRAFQPRGNSVVAGSGEAISLSSNGSASPATGDAVTGQKVGAIILDGYSRAYVLNLAKTLNQAPLDAPLAQGFQDQLRTRSAVTGPLAVSITVRQPLADGPNVDLAEGRLSHQDAERSRAIAGTALARLTPKTAAALGISETGRTLQQRLADAPGLPFLVARDPLGRSGFWADAGNSMAVRHQFGPMAVTVASEQGKVFLPEDQLRPDRSNYSMSSISVERRQGRAALVVTGSQLKESSTVLGGHFAFARTGATTYFLDASAAYQEGVWGAAASYRRGWTSLPAGTEMLRGGTMRSDAFAVDLWRHSALTNGDLIALRVMQPLRVGDGGYRLNLPATYDYASGSVGYQLRQLSLVPSGRELDFEAAYSLPLFGGSGWLTANAFLRRQPGHGAAMRSDPGAALRFGLGF